MHKIKIYKFASFQDILQNELPTTKSTQSQTTILRICPHINNRPPLNFHNWSYTNLMSASSIKRSSNRVYLCRSQLNSIPSIFIIPKTPSTTMAFTSIPQPIIKRISNPLRPTCPSKRPNPLSTRFQNVNLSAISTLTTTTTHPIQTSPSTPKPIQSSPLPGHPSWRYIGAPIDPTNPTPLPTIIYFALTSSQSLELDPFNQFVKRLLPSSPSSASFRVLSVTLPYHTSDMVANEAVFTAWADVYSSGGDLLTSYIRRVNDTIEKLIHDRVIASEQVYVAGLSRGGLIAALLAAKSAHVKAVLGFAPVTVLADLPEFTEALKMDGRVKERLHRASLLNDHVLQALVGKPLRFYMGNFDRRVGTRNAFEVVHRLAEMAGSKRVRSPPHEFVMYCRYVFVTAFWDVLNDLRIFFANFFLCDCVARFMIQCRKTGTWNSSVSLRESIHVRSRNDLYSITN